MVANDDLVYNSYMEAYAQAASKPGDQAGKGAHAGRGVESGSHASTEFYQTPVRKVISREPTPYFDFSYEPLPQKTPSVLHLPPRTVPSKITEDTWDSQHERDTHAFERTANVYRSLVHQHYHHNKPQGSHPTLWERGHIVDKGRRRCDGHRDQHDILHHTEETMKRPQT
eukprot:gene17831-24214_t